MSLVDWELHASLPQTRPLDEILETNDVSGYVKEHRSYEWNGWSFDVPPGVFLPGPTSQLVHDMLLTGAIPVHGRRYGAMGAGLGVELVIAGLAGASSVHSIDVHASSVETAARGYRRIVDESGPPLRSIVSDLWTSWPAGEQLDVITFNPPFIEARLSNDPAIVRNICSGSPLAERFFSELAETGVLSPTGTLYLTLSNTAPLRDIVAMALRSGLTARVVHTADWSGDKVTTFVFAMEHRPGARARLRTVDQKEE